VSLTSPTDAVEPTTDARIEAEVQRALAGRLVANEPISLAAHVVLIAVVALILWGAAPSLLLCSWVAAVPVVVVIRWLALRRARQPGFPTKAVVRVVRLAVVASALPWGVGAAAIFPETSLARGALILVVLAGLVAGGTATLVTNTLTFRLFTLLILGPLPVGILAGGTDRLHGVMVFLVFLYGGLMSVVNRRAHLALFDHLRSSARLRVEEEASERDRAHLDALLESAPVAIVVEDRDGRILRVNPRFTTLFGYGAESIGAELDALIVPVSERPKAHQLDRKARKGETVVAEVERRRKDGRLVPVRASAAAVGGAEGEVFVMYEDIADRRRADEARTQLVSIVETSEDAIIGQDLAGAIRSWNAGAERMFGYDLARIVGKPIATLVPPDLASEGNDILDRIRRGERVQHFETVRISEAGQRIPVSLSVSVTRDRSQRVSGFSWIARDISVQEAARIALQDARDAAEHAARARSQFLANMSHEIRTPMNAVLGMTELLLDTELTAEQRRSLGLVRTSGETLLALINDILDFSKIDAEHLELEDIAFDLRELLEATASLLAVRARGKGIELFADVGTSVPQMVRGDPTRLRQVFTNLVGNAIKFTERGEVVLSAAPTGDCDGRTSVAFAVRDTGIGIAADQLGHIFEEFVQADATMTRRYGGTGLGLAIARRLVLAMGGDLSVTSELGKGTEFAFQLPFVVEAAPPILTPGGISLAGRRMLIVDDNTTNRRILREMLGAVGIDVIEAASVDAGLAALHRARADDRPCELAIVDAQMPDRDGFALATDVRRDPTLTGLRLMMLTSAGQRGDARRCRELGIEGYLTKPIPRKDLIDGVAAVLRGEAPARRSQVVTRYTIAESRRHLRVLLAEDNPVNQEVAATMLRKRGHKVHVVSDGREAVEAVKASTFDVILMDVQMPEMDGFAATRAIRELPGGKDLRIVALTAHALTGERERCLASGMNGYLAKPFKPDALFVIVEEGDATGLVSVGPGLRASGASEPISETTESPVNLEEFRCDLREAGAEEALDGILATFIESTPKRLAALEAAAAADDLPGMQRAAHAYKSAAGAIGARALAELLKVLELASQDGAVAGVRAGLQLVRHETERVLEFLRGFRGDAPKV